VYAYVFRIEICSVRGMLKNIHIVIPNVAKVGGLQSQGVEGEVVVIYREPLTTQDLMSSGFPAGLTTWQN